MLVFVCCEYAPELRSNTKGGEYPGGETRGVDLRRFTVAGEFKTGTLVCAQRSK